MILDGYNIVRFSIKADLKNVRKVHLVLNEWSSSQKIAFLEVLIYWLDDEFRYREHLIEFTFFNVSHADVHLMHELLKLLEFYEIKNKFFAIIIDNASNNTTCKKELKKILNRRDYSWDRKENSISCLAHVINLIAQNFIKALESNTTHDSVITSLKDEQVNDVRDSSDMTVVIKKMSDIQIMHLNNAFK